jgi:hypothetical protein
LEGRSDGTRCTGFGPIKFGFAGWGTAPEGSLAGVATKEDVELEALGAFGPTLWGAGAPVVSACPVFEFRTGLTSVSLALAELVGTVEPGEFTFAWTVVLEGSVCGPRFADF